MKSSYGNGFKLRGEGCYFLLAEIQSKRDNVSLCALVVDVSYLHFFSNSLLKLMTRGVTPHSTSKISFFRIELPKPVKLLSL